MRMERLHPLTLFLNLLYAMLPAMFCMNPWMQLISFVGALALYFQVREGARGKEWRWLVLFFVTVTVIHPLFSHNGKTVLFYVNGNRITLEACLFGAVTAFMMVGILIWCRSLSILMTGDRVVYLLGRISGKAALLCSMALRFVPMFRRQLVKTRQSQQLLGLYKEGTFLDKLQAELRIFSAVVTWAFEHSMDTADSMQARGYGNEKRTQYTNYRIRFVDVLLIGVGALLVTWIGIVYAGGSMTPTYYPVVSMPESGWKEGITYVVYAVLCLMLPCVQLVGKIRLRKRFRD